MGLRVNDFKYTLDGLFGANAQLQLKQVSPWYAYDENNKSSEKKQLGYKYLMAELEHVVKFTVKVEGEIPVISNEELQKTSSPVYASFVNSKVSFYGNSLYDCDLSVTAEKILIKGKSA